MSRKRHNTSSPEIDSSPSSERQFHSYESDSDTSSTKQEEPSTDARTGQVGAFPGLNNDGNDELFYGPATNGVDYLRMVRSEARGIPCFLSTTKDQSGQPEEHLDKKCDGFYGEDEAFVGGPMPKDSELMDNLFSKHQRTYYATMITRFNILRARMRLMPSLNRIQALPQWIPISFPPASKPAKQLWEAHVLQHPAHPVQIACMDPGSVFELIRLITRKMRKYLQPSQSDITLRLSTWTWGLLARCPDRGELGSEEIADLRACAKAADATWKWLHHHRRRSTTSLDADNRDVGTDDDTDSSIEDTTELGVMQEEMADVQGHSQSHRLNDAGGPARSESNPLQSQQIFLDMIITIVGETYGQTDLLELRRPWGAGHLKSGASGALTIPGVAELDW